MGINLKRKSKLKNIIVYMIMIFAIIGVTNQNIAKAAQPKVMLIGYETDKKEINCGDNFKLTITLKNTYSYSVKNMKIIVSSENGEILPANGTAGTAYMSSMSGETEESIIFDMRATEGLSEKSYKLNIKLEYEDGYGTPYTVDDSIFIPIYLTQKVSMSDFTTSDDSVDVGDDIGISGKINNLGDGKLYKVTVVVQGSNIEEQKSFIGDIEPGKSGNFDVYVRTTSVEDSMDKIIIQYEDIKGNVHEQEEKFRIAIDKPLYDDILVVKEDTKKDNSKVIIICAVAFIIVLCIIIGVRKISKKKRILDEYN